MKWICVALFLTLFNLCFIYCLPLNVLALSSRNIEVIALVAEGTDSLSTADGLNESGSPKSVSNVNIV